MYIKNMEKNKINLFQIIITIFSLISVNYLTIRSIDTTQVLIVFILLQVLLYKMNPLCAFVFCFVMNTNLMNNFTFLWSKPLTILFSFSIFIFNPKLLGLVFKNNKLKNVFLCSILFSFYVIIISIMSKTNIDYKIILNNFNIIFGFLIILPTYYFAIKQPKDFFILLAYVSGIFLLIYYLNIIYNLNLFKLREADTTISSNLTRTMGYDLRQFIIIFFYLIPAFIFTKSISAFNKNLIIYIGIGAYFVIILAVYRLALFYNLMGLLLSMLLLSKYINVTKLFKKVIIIALLLIVIIYFFNNYFIELQKVFSGTIDYFSGKKEDNSADERFLNQLPILLGIIYNNFWTGCGVIMSASITGIGEMYGFVDFPILGSLATFGFAGMIIYYFRFYYILNKNINIKKNKYKFFNEKDKLLLNIMLTLRAYLIVMITFRFFYISWELAFDWQQSEFGLITGSFLGLEHIIQQKIIINKKIWK